MGSEFFSSFNTLLKNIFFINYFAAWQAVTFFISCNKREMVLWGCEMGNIEGKSTVKQEQTLIKPINQSAFKSLQV